MAGNKHAATLCLVHEFCAGLLHWFTSPYVHSLEYDRPTGNVTVQTLNILGQPRYSSFNKSEAAYPATMRPQVTFEVGRLIVHMHVLGV